MKIRNTIILLIIAILIGGYIYLYERKQLTTEEKKERAGKVWTFKSEDVTKLQIKKGEETILCRKESKDYWQIEKPMQMRADESEIDKILSKLEFLKKERAINEDKEKPLAMGEFGIAQPKMEVSIWVKDEPFTLLLGNDSPAGNNIYAGLKGKKEIYLVEKGVIDTLNKKVDDLRDKRVLTFEMEGVEKLQLRSQETTILCGKENGQWQVLEPEKVKAKESEVNDILWALEGLRAKKFIQSEKGKEEEYGLAKPEFELTLSLKDNVTKTIIIGKEVSEESAHYARTSDTDAIFLLDSEKIKALKKDLKDLKEEPEKKEGELTSGENEELQKQ
ncbi:MAG: DUF4340 domain-containing protein [Candidatus Omnitrophica bacterium]|nr:DUF4340 domain-containing protein [Candidatus Omnitrophota bacterium]